MKKVLIVATVAGHINAFHISSIKELKKMEYEVHVATRRSNEVEFCDKAFEVEFARNPINVKNYKAYEELKKIINENDYEIIHCHTPVGGVLARLAARKARKKRTRVIYTAHGFHFYKGAPLFNWLIYYPIEKWLSKYTDCLITINQEDYDLAKKKFKKCKQIELVHGVGVDESKFDFEMSNEEKHELRKSLGLKDDDFVLIQVGELNRNKNQIMAIKAMRELVKENSNIHLLLVGKGKLEKIYRQKIEEYGLQENIHILGFRKDIPQLMKIANVLLSLSYREGLPVNVIEGMLCGLPIIATDCRGNRDLVKNSQNGFIITTNTEFIEKCLEINKNGKNELKKQIAIKINMKKYLLENIIKEIKKIYGIEEKKVY